MLDCKEKYFIKEDMKKMEMSDVLSIVAIVISVMFSIFSIVWTLKSKRYELTSVYRKEMISWYSDVTELLNALRDDISLKKDSEVKDKLSKLSVFIDQGRFYFPNIVTDEKHGKEKPTAFQGHRVITLDLLVAYYDIARREDASAYKKQLIKLQRYFTSKVFDRLQPRDFVKRAGRFTSISADKEYSLEAFLKSNSEEELLRLYKEGKKDPEF